LAAGSEFRNRTSRCPVIKPAKPSKGKMKLNSRRVIRLVCAVTFGATIALSTPPGSSVETGKATFNNSCIHCHGTGGGGNLGQDKFWNVRIPRLNQEYVQKKSDEELTSVILNGRRKMPAAVMGKPHASNTNKVKPEQVPDLLAYIRSLKK
jgi:mono/diheme cytochrome c family protein